ncbi:hypothetical protein EJ05DRAFT_489868 [Pseudovirgaria hyperparasitica]|uniref:Uncharacterized protein n=1 Tax=Pseudovirgaria hyperparasitica TaxID=470096 RepID=A0A6A6VSX0_9PEZI|nr:uncharacterized protein EJ05DRAFT_489868 [Pseudovirgaria hyperparasitica]KAF2753682.1 hypothetical protein EJ05DRAFT_489868 [Pseudovirgaria hyperparasitica]
MSSSIPIPRRKRKSSSHSTYHINESSSSSSASSSSSSYKRTPFSHSPTTPPQAAIFGRDRRPSLLSESISKTEHIVINIGQPDAPRLISCVKASQGFDWNPDIFLPSYHDHDYGDLERKQEPVKDIILTDEEIKNMLPQ